MRLLADENLPGAAVHLLRQDGHDVAWIREDSLGASDPDVIDRAMPEQRILITFDTDFGELVFRLGLPASCGVIPFRVSPRTAAEIARVASEAISTRADWAGHFSVVEVDRVRMTRLG